jgi:hypothetical protein
VVNNARHPVARSCGDFRAGLYRLRENLVADGAGSTL